MRKILCFIGFHDWVYNSQDIEVGTERVCECCDRKEIYVLDRVNSLCVWYRIR